MITPISALRQVCPQRPTDIPKIGPVIHAFHTSFTDAPAGAR
ncbi:MAG: hypothetical protein ACRDGJ_13060 [Candidatus Limnocylindria bacterium]